MLFPAELWEGLEAGTVTVAFRAWKRPTVRAGGTLQSPGGLLSIDEVAAIEAAEITEQDARAAGASSVAEVVGGLRGDGERRLYRIRFHRLGDDPRLVLRERSDLTGDEAAAIDAQLARWDAASRTGPWTSDVLDVVARRPGEVSTALADELGHDRMQLKGRIRQLKGLGLTISLGVGYRLSPRGEAYLATRSA